MASSTDRNTLTVQPNSSSRPQQEPIDGDSSNQNHTHASVVQTVLNLCKTCMGTGTLALPFAAQQGGILLYTVGMVLIMGWNLFSIERLIDCLRLLPEGDDVHRTESVTNAVRTSRGTNGAGSSQGDVEALNKETPTSETTALVQLHSTTATSLTPIRPPPNTSTLGQVAWYALGPNGLFALDIMFVILLCGIIVAYEDAMLSFLHDTPLPTTKTFNATVTCLIMALVSVVPHMGHLARVSAMGLGVLLMVFVLIAWYAGSVPMNDSFYFHSTLAASSLPLFPHNQFQGVSHWFGCVVFSFGTVPLTYNMRDSMRHPQYMVFPASTVALSIVALCYIAVGVGLLLLYPPDSINGDVLSLLPTHGWLPTTIRCCMTLVVLVTAPLLIVPCGELIESKVLRRSTVYFDQESITHMTSDHVLSKFLVRLSICVVCTVVALCVPGFVYVLSFVGACCVALVSFIVPSLLHLVLDYKRHRATGMAHTNTWRRRLGLLLDVIMLVWGVAATLITSVYTFSQMIAQPS